jgi:hypothetical protein
MQDIAFVAISEDASLAFMAVLMMPVPKGLVRI